MWKIPTRVLVAAILALMFLFSSGSLEVFAEQSVKVPPNAKVVISGKTAIISGGGGGGAGETGSYECNCGGSGTCKLTRGSNMVLCTNNSPATCNGACTLTTSTTGLNPGIAAAKSKSGSGPGGGAQAPAQSK